MREKLENLLRARLPRKLITGYRFWQIYNHRRGHSQRDCRGFPVAPDGQPVPWITYPAMDFLDTLDLSEASVFEYGSGASTVWWAARARFVAAVEFDRTWHAKVCALGFLNAEVRLCQDKQRYPLVIADFQRGFDVVVIDGAERYRCAEQALANLNPGGLIVLDNTEWYPNTAAMLRAHDLLQIDFSGFGPLNAFPWVTSIFLCRDSMWLGNKRLAQFLPPGGKSLKHPAPDDRATGQAAGQ